MRGRRVPLSELVGDALGDGPAVGEARLTSWQVAHASVPSFESRVSK